MPVPMPVVVDIDVVGLAFAVAHVRPIGSRALPQLPIEPRGRRGRLAVADGGAVVVVPGAGVMHGTDVAVMNPLDGLDNCWVRSSLRTELHDAVVLPRGGNGKLSFAWVVARGLLNINVLAGRAAED